MKYIIRSPAEPRCITVQYVLKSLGILQHIVRVENVLSSTGKLPDLYIYIPVHLSIRIRPLWSLITINVRAYPPYRYARHSSPPLLHHLALPQPPPWLCRRVAVPAQAKQAGCLSLTCTMYTLKSGNTSMYLEEALSCHRKQIQSADNHLCILRKRFSTYWQVQCLSLLNFLSK